MTADARARLCPEHQRESLPPSSCVAWRKPAASPNWNGWSNVSRSASKHWKRTTRRTRRRTQAENRRHYWTEDIMTSERWRYCCPECGAHALVSRVSLGGYRCDVCETVVERRYDKKRDTLTA